MLLPRSIVLERGAHTNCFAIRSTSSPGKDLVYKVEMSIEAGNYHLPDRRPSGPLIGREDAVNIMKRYIKESMQNEGKVDGKFQLLGTSGMKGIGKSALLLHGVDVVVPQAVTELAEERILQGPALAAQAVYLTFNGGTGMTDRFVEAFRAAGSSSYHNFQNAFGSALLASHGVDMKAAQKFDFAESLKLYRKILHMSEQGSLVLMVDEVDELSKALDEQPESATTLLLAALMRGMDEGNGKLVFIFSHIRQDVLNEQATGSGRKVVPLCLPALTIDVWALEADLKEAAEQHPGLHQLLLSCCGHPRSVFDGIKRAKSDIGSLLSNPSEVDLVTARMVICDECKFIDFGDRLLGETVPRWFSVLEPLETAELARDGMLLIINNASSAEESVEFFHPLLIQSWAKKHLKTQAIAYHLNNVYANDAILGSHTEKMMEAVMYHYEAVLRKTVEGRYFSLQSFYKSQHIGEKLKTMEVSAKVPSGTNLVENVNDFSDVGRVLELLNGGYIVVSKFHSEFGIEYLSPFTTPEGKLIVAAAQCKFSAKNPDWARISNKINDATANLVKTGVECFPVVYTSADQCEIRGANYASGVCFTALDLFEFTKKLGVLRLHSQKLGRVMKHIYPWLDSAATQDSAASFPGAA